MSENNSHWVGISEIQEKYLPLSKRRVRKFIALYLEPKRFGHRIFVERAKLEALLSDPDRERFPLNL